MNKIFYDPKLKELARQLRNNSTRAEIKLWGYLKGRQLRGTISIDKSQSIITLLIFSVID